MSNRNKLIIGIVALAFVTYWVFAFDIPYRHTVDDFETCAAAGHPILQTFPEQCVANGVTYVQQTDSATSTADVIFNEAPADNSTVSSPVKVTGQARGQWFSEAQFPVQVIAADGSTVLGQATAHADSSDGSWMTSAFVPWTADVTFARGTSTSGFIRLVKDNPSGNPATDAHVDIPVNFATTTGTSGGQ